MKILALDANSIINRAFYGIRLLSNKNGVYTNAIYGFMNILFKLEDENKPDLIIAAFDLKAPTFRHKIYSDYKAGRKPMPDELRQQIPLMKKILKAYGCIVLEKEGYEADDILGTIAKKSDLNNDSCIIATGDRDSLQLVSDKVNIHLAATKAGSPEVRIYDIDRIKEEYGVTPKQMIEIKALQGDTSDNIPGVRGIGPKTASNLIQQFGSIENLYENIETADLREKLKTSLIEEKENAFLSKTLGTINCEVPIEIPAEACGDNDELKRILVDLEMFKILDKLNIDFSKTVETDSIKKEIIDFKVINFIPENSIVLADGEQFFAKNGNDYFIIENPDFSDSKGIITHNCKELFHKANGYIDIAFDTMLAAYLINPDKNNYSLERFAIEYKVVEFEGEHCEVAKNLNLIENLYKDFLEKIKENSQENLLYNIEIPLSYTLYLMEKEGFEVDKEGIENFGELLSKRETELQNLIYNIIGYEFNLNSPKQLGVALFEKLGLPHSKKTKTGYSTNAEVLEKLKYESDAVEYLLEYRSVSKLKSTYCDGLLKCIDSKDNRIHSTLNQVETRTGRISSSEPNLQNIPVRTELGREMRKFFRAKDGYLLVDADYSQIELRVLASIAEDKKMIEAFNNGDDIHTITASQVFNVPIELMTPEIRSRAKAVNFGIVYGIGAFSLSKDIHVSVAEAKKYIENYLSTYNGVQKYLENCVEKAKSDGYVSTLFGRRRYLPELNASNHNIKSFGERVAKNMPIQGTAADIIKIAMNKVNNRLISENLDAKLIMQIHDELIIEAKEDIAEKVASILKEEMENAVKMSVPMTVDVKYAKTWYETK